MAAPIVAQIAYTGTALTAQITSGPWDVISALLPEYGSLPISPQFVSEILQPMHMDAARYRRGGAHFPKFHLMSIMGATDYATASAMARQLELTQNDYITLELFTADQGRLTCYVDSIRAKPVAKPVVGGVVASGGWGSPVSASACVDAEWLLQAVAA